MAQLYTSGSVVINQRDRGWGVGWLDGVAGRALRLTLALGELAGGGGNAFGSGKM